jgi:hypothetical protein
VIDAGVPPIDTRKLFWDTYPYRIEFDNKLLTRITLARSQKFRAPTIHNEVLEAIGASGKTTARRAGDLTTVYFVDEADALAFFNRTVVSVTEVTCPRCPEDIALLAGDGTRLKVVFRKNLFWHKFPYRVTLTDDLVNTGKFAEMKDWIHQFSEVSPVENVIELHGGNPSAAYFTDENDLLFFKLVFHEQIFKLEKALLIKDIADEPVSLEGAC